jgi:ADP-ribose pyrophosphatase YjhB (NUDIX family)
MDILKLFQYNEKLTFTDIKDALNIRSNKLAYHLKKLTKKDILKNEEGYYFLSETSEHLIPYISEKNSALPVILIHVGNSKEALLYRRNKRPYHGLLSMPGGRILIGESLNDAVKRILKRKFNLDSQLEKIHSVSLEHVKKSGKLVHSFLLIFVSAKTKEKIALTNLKKNKSKIISSDYHLLLTHLSKETKIRTINSKTNE